MALFMFHTFHVHVTELNCKGGGGFVGYKKLISAYLDHSDNYNSGPNFIPPPLNINLKIRKLSFLKLIFI